MKYRICKVTHDGESFYITQKKWLFIWITLTFSIFDDLGEQTYDYTFDTPKEAEEYVNMLKNEGKIEIIKEL